MCPAASGPSKIMGTSTLHIPHGTHTKCAWDHYSQQTRKMPTSPGGRRRLGTLRPDHSGALIGTGANNCKLIVVKPEKRDGYMPDPPMTQSIKEAPKRGLPIEEITVPARERPQS